MHVRAPSHCISGASIKVTNLAFVASEELPISPMANIELTTG
eukprot:COSAG01_NODE_31822_length_590_cov_21.260692_1_plen_41_part_10